MMTSNAGCRFCSYLDCQGSDLVDKPWMSNASFAALVSKGALVPGWSLLCPRMHSLSMAKSFRVQTFWDFATKAIGVVESRFGPVCVFEHGATHAGSATGCGTDHAHLHVVPLGFSLQTQSEQYGGVDWKPCYARDIESKVAGREYLFVADKWDHCSTRGLIAVLGEPVSQFFRRLIAQRLGLADLYDYRRYPMLDIARASSKQLFADVQASVEA
jgi:hypothetical protein